MTRAHRKLVTCTYTRGFANGRLDIIDRTTYLIQRILISWHSHIKFVTRTYTTGFANGRLHVIDRTTYLIQRILSAGPDPVHCVGLSMVLKIVVCGTSGGRVAAWQVADVRCV